jgi:predicted patatin/cPLA2 family phospholipase
MNIARNAKKLNISRLKRQKIPFFISLYDFRNDKIEYFNIKDADPYLILRAAICIVPYTFCRQELNGIDFIDGTIKEPINLDYFLKKYPNRKIIIVFNGRRASGIRHNLKGWAEGVVASSMLKNKLYSSYISRESKVRKDIKNALSNSRVLLVYPDKKSPVRPRSRDYSTLMATFNQGLSKGKEIAKFV